MNIEAEILWNRYILLKAIESLLQKSSSTVSSDDALKFTEAALNTARITSILKQNLGDK